MAVGPVRLQRQAARARAMASAWAHARPKVRALEVVERALALADKNVVRVPAARVVKVVRGAMAPAAHVRHAIPAPLHSTAMSCHARKRQ